MSYEQFLKSGIDTISQNVFLSEIMEIQRISLGAEFIVTGFTPDRQPMLVVTHECEAHIYDNFAVIGEGYILATASLLRRAHHDVATMADALYHVYEAKKYAEGVRSVGSATSLHIFHADGGNTF